MLLNLSNRRVGVFIDVQNMYYSARNIYGSKVNFGNIVKHAVDGQQLIRAIAYTISTKGGDETPFFEALHKMGIEVNTKELLEYDSGQKKGDWDVGITIDAVRMMDMVDVIVLVSGDGDYVPLGEYAKNRGRLFHVVSFRESTSSKLIECADIYTNLSDDLPGFLLRDPHYRPTTYRKTSAIDTFSDVIAEQEQNKVLPALSQTIEPMPMAKRSVPPRKEAAVVRAPLPPTAPQVPKRPIVGNNMPPKAPSLGPKKRGRPAKGKIAN